MSDLLLNLYIKLLSFSFYSQFWDFYLTLENKSLFFGDTWYACDLLTVCFSCWFQLFGTFLVACRVIIEHYVCDNIEVLHYYLELFFFLKTYTVKAYYMDP